ncbi:MAG: hypothetical protein PHR62_08610 [Paludibacter sp.]|jgi:hypothetical protein|nr:hypothetical protein [Paludibacter sp.]
MKYLSIVKKITFLISLFFLFPALNAQINMEDSTVQVIGYWDKNEKQSYQIQEKKATVVNEDTTSSQEFSYKVDVQIVDSTAESYTIEWKYFDYKYISGPQELKTILTAYQPTKVLVKTDEMGMFAEIINSAEISAAMTKRLKNLIKKYKSDQYLVSEFTALIDKYASKDAVEQLALSEIQQYYNYHGGRYKLDENLSATVKSPFMNLEEGIDAELNVWLSEINVDDNNYILQMSKILDEEAMKKLMYEEAKNDPELTPDEKPEIHDMPELKVETWAASRIHNSGWIVYSVQTVEVLFDNEKSTEERTIELL